MSHAYPTELAYLRAEIERLREWQREAVEALREAAKYSPDCDDVLDLIERAKP